MSNKVLVRIKKLFFFRKYFMRLEIRLSKVFIGLCKTIKSFPYYRVCNAILAFIFVVNGVILRWRFLKKAAAGSPLAKIFAVLLFWVNLLFYVYVGLCICRNIQVIINKNVTTEQKNILENMKVYFSITMYEKLNLYEN